MRPNRDWLTEKSPEERLAFEQAWLANEFTERMCEFMEREGVSRAELARRLGVSKAHVTQVLRGKNITLRTAAALAYALGHWIDLSMQRLELQEGQEKSERETVCPQVIWGRAPEPAFQYRTVRQEPPAVGPPQVLVGAGVSGWETGA